MVNVDNDPTSGRKERKQKWDVIERNTMGCQPSPPLRNPSPARNFTIAPSNGWITTQNDATNAMKGFSILFMWFATQESFTILALVLNINKHKHNPSKLLV